MTTPGFITRWVCDLPEEGKPFVVTKDEWDESDPPLRTIREWHYVPKEQDS
jgi:hypothetical protein